MFFPINSLRTRFILTAGLFIALILPAVIYTQSKVNHASDERSQYFSEQQKLISQINLLEASVRNTETELYFYALSLGLAEKNAVAKNLANAKNYVEKIAEDPFVVNNTFLHDTANALQRSIVEVENKAQALFDILASVETRFPAAPILLEKLQPMNSEFKSAIEQALSESKELMSQPVQTNVANLFKDLRYVWEKQVGSVRMFVANRSGIFGQPNIGMAGVEKDRKIYSDRVGELLVELESYANRGQLGFVQTAAVKQLKVTWRLYDKYFADAAAIYQSNDWRADIPYFNNQMRPSLANFWQMLSQFQQGLDGQTKDYMTTQVHITDSLSNIIVLFFVFLLIAFSIAYLVLEYVIRRPLVEVTKALDAEAVGDSYSPAVPYATSKETGYLLSAFNEMREQVRSRQKRLQSILDNAGEGIITMDSQGTIETFNRAAQRVFGYRADEVVGKSCDDVIRMAVSRSHGTFLEFCKSPLSQDHINEVVVSVYHKDDSIFPMSLNVSDIWDEGRQLFVVIVEDISERIALMDNLRTMAEHDSLTGLYNREYFMTELDRVVENIKRGVRGSYALLYIDLDNFKFVNDTLGHIAGDQLLVEVTQMFTRRNRKSDLLARLGGDEFAILIVGAKRSQVIAAAESHRRLLSDYTFKFNGKVVNVGCSIGVTLFGQEPLIKENLLAQADIACHIAKRAGRNRVHIYKHDDRRNVTAMSEDMGWATMIKNAIDTQALVMMVQPIASIADGNCDRFEVLLRMRSEDGQLIQPSGFLPAAERFGLIRSIDQWVVTHAIELLSKAQRRNPNTRFAINLSAKSLDDDGMFKVITSALELYEVDPTFITFEITENIAISNLNSSIDFLQRLRALGCHTALDDFGVGYSSFAYLKDLPVDFVKIDGSFVRNIEKDNLQYTMVRSMNDVAHAMGKVTVAEYVDSRQSLEHLIQIGVDYAQGFYIGQPKVMLFDTAATSNGSNNIVSA